MSSSYLLRDRTQLLIDFLDRGDKQHLSRGQSPESFRTTGRQTDRQRNAQPKPTKCKSSGLRTPQSEDTSIIADREREQAVARLLPDPRPPLTHGLRRHRPDERQLLGDVFPLARAVLRDVIPDLFVLSIRVRWYARPRQVFCFKYTADAGWRGIRSSRLPEASAPVAKPIRGQHAVGGGGRGAIVWTDMCTSETAW